MINQLLQSEVIGLFDFDTKRSRWFDRLRHKVKSMVKRSHWFLRSTSTQHKVIGFFDFDTKWSHWFVRLRHKVKSLFCSTLTQWAISISNHKELDTKYTTETHFLTFILNWTPFINLSTRSCDTRDEFQFRYHNISTPW